MNRLLILCLFILSALKVNAQTCTPEWLPGDGFPGVDVGVECGLAWDPDGPGPQADRLVVGGYFSFAGTVQANRVAVWDGSTWSGLGSGPGFNVQALAAQPDGTLIAGGAGAGSGANEVSLWNGIAWTPLGSGFSNGDVHALCVLPGGDIIAGGSFTLSNGILVNRVARWNGTSWSAIGSGLTTQVNALAALPGGEVLAAASTRVYRWNGTAWTQVGGTFNGQVETLLRLSNGNVIAGGSFTTSGTIAVNAIALWNGTAWGPLGGGIGPGYVYSVTELPNGDIVAGGDFGGAGGIPTTGIARWNGSAWFTMADGIRGWLLATVCLSSGEIFGAGHLTPGGSSSRGNVTRWSGSEWLPVGTGMEYGVSALAALPDGKVVAGGQFTVAGGQVVRGIAVRNGDSWTPLSTGMVFTAPGGAVYNGTVSSLAALGNGDIVAGGGFTSAGGVPASRIARWNGTAWSALGAGMSGIDTNVYVSALLVHSSGDLYAGGRFTEADGVAVNGIARWNGSAWSDLFSGTDGTVSAIVEMPGGDIVAAGMFTHAAGAPANNIARWNGVSWQPLGTGIEGVPGATSVQALAVLPNGNLVAGGSFTTAGGVPAINIALWNGVSWAPLGSGVVGTSGPAVLDFTISPSGDLVITGRFSTANGIPANNIVRHVPATNSWHAFGSGIDGYGYALAFLSDGTLAVGGYLFTLAGPQVSPNFARWGCPPCYANCDGSTAQPVLTGNDFQCFLNRCATNDPWANCDGSSVPPTLNANDFQCFLNAFAAGCPN